MRDTSLHSGERQVHENFKGIEYWHKWRYLQALDYVKDKTVLDIGCGCGYGSFILSIMSSFVTGVDDSKESIIFAKQHWTKHHMEYVCCDVCQYNPGKEFEVVVAFEVIEHIEQTYIIMDKIKKFNPQTIVFSVPHISEPIAGKQFHKKHFEVNDILGHFKNRGYKPKRLELLYFDRDMVSKNNLNIFGVMERE
jgi:2-polyprenyl-3-methyl-5-hydroxy-6-metoxy-1,4-benzoquinol methylase